MRGFFGALPREMRVKQWTKNLLVYAAILFSGNLFQEQLFMLATIAFFACCFVSSGIYFFNDIFDIEKDRANPQKARRPIASGVISINEGYGCFLFFILLGFIMGAVVSYQCFWLLLSYMVLNIFYTVWLKHVVIVDVMIIAYGFVARSVIGAIAIERNMTIWFILCVMFLSLFLALGKRRHELILFENKTLQETRSVLQFYNLELIDQMISIVSAALIMCYALFTMDEHTQNHQMMIFTVPLVLYGVFYYLYLVRVKKGGGAPDQALYMEKPLLIVVLAYVMCVILIRNL